MKTPWADRVPTYQELIQLIKQLSDSDTQPSSEELNEIQEAVTDFVKSKSKSKSQAAGGRLDEDFRLDGTPLS